MNLDELKKLIIEASKYTVWAKSRVLIIEAGKTYNACWALHGFTHCVFEADCF